MSEAWWWRGWSSVVCRSLLEQPSARTAINKNQPQHAWGAALALLSSTPHLAQHSEGRLAERADPSSSALSLIGAIGKSGKVESVIITKSFQMRGRSVQEASACWRGGVESRRERRGEREEGREDVGQDK
jgi:hypothetical protein